MLLYIIRYVSNQSSDFSPFCLLASQREKETMKDKRLTMDRKNISVVVYWYPALWEKAIYAYLPITSKSYGTQVDWLADKINYGCTSNFLIFSTGLTALILTLNTKVL